MKKTDISKWSIKVFLLLLLLPMVNCKKKEIRVKDFKSDVVLLWNEKLMDLAIEKDGLLTLNGVRTEAMALSAMHNALNTIQSKFHTYEFQGKGSDANPIAAITQAAFEVAKIGFPKKVKELRKFNDAILAEIEEGTVKSGGVRLGKEVAEKIITIRTNDAWNAEAEYTWHPMAPGVYAEFNEHSGTPEGFVFGAGWAQAEPFMLSSPNQFMAPPPPSIQSKAYTLAFNEVKEFGSTNSEVRSDDQSHFAMWWKDFIEKSANKLARELIVKEKLDLWEATRALALLNMTIYDAYISVFSNKFKYNHWRPYTAIRWAANDDNPNTVPDEAWNNLHRHTYAFPSYPSAHGTAASAAMRVLSNTLGKGDSYSFEMSTRAVESAGPFSEKIQMNPTTRSFNSFTEAGLEASLSRIYLGIHFRYDSEVGHNLGNQIGDFTSRNFLTEIDGHN